VVDAADVDDAVEDDVALDELDEGEELSLLPQAVATVSAAVNAIPTPKIRTRPIAYLHSVTAISTAVSLPRQ
jgi:hypothetical protein